MTKQVKKAQLVWTYTETQKKMEQMKQSIIRTRQEISEMNEKFPDYKDRYFEHYMKARRDAHIPDDDNSFIKFMLEDADLGF